MFFHVPTWFFNYTCNDCIMMYHYTLCPIVEYLSCFQYFIVTKSATIYIFMHMAFFFLPLILLPLDSK
jgi:hypothetical protein